MGFFSNLIKSAISEGIRKGVSEAVEEKAESVLAPKAEELTEQLNAAAEDVKECAAEGFDADFAPFPKWDATAIEDLSEDSGDDYKSISVTAKLTDDLIGAYQSKLAANGFSGDWQLMSKEIAGKKYTVDFSFVSDSQIQYLIRK